MLRGSISKAIQRYHAKSEKNLTRFQRYEQSIVLTQEFNVDMDGKQTNGRDDKNHMYLSPPPPTYFVRWVGGGGIKRKNKTCHATLCFAVYRYTERNN